MVLKIPIISTFNNRGIKSAEKEIGSFSKTLKKFGLASKLSVAGVTASLGILAKQSIAAAIAEEKAVKSLSLTLKNLGIAAADKRVLEFINRLQFATGVSEDQLRPAFQRLVTITGDVTRSQELLALAMDVSAGTGKSLDSVVMALSRAYNGNNASLSRLGVNISKAELKTMSFQQVTDKLGKTFAGQAAAAADTFGGRMAKLGVAADEAKEIIGNSLNKSIDRFIENAGGIDQVTQSMLSFASATGKAVEAIGLLGSGVQTALPSKNLLQRLADNFAQFGASVSGFGQNFRPFQMGAQSYNGGFNLAGRYSEDKRMANRVKELKLAQAIPKASAAELRNQRQIAANKKLAAKFDQENIAIEAALKGKLSDEDRARVLALKALKSESNADDEKALNSLNELQKNAANQEIERIKAMAEARSAAITKEKQERQALQEWLKANPMTVYTTSIIEGRGVTTPPGFGTPPGSNAASIPPTNAGNLLPQLPQGMSYGQYGATGDIIVNVNAGTIADENKLTYIISNEITKFVRFGGILAPAGFI